MMGKFLKRFLLIAIVTLIIANVIAFASYYFLRKSNFFKPSYLINHFDPSEKFDLIVLGSSRGLTTIDVSQVTKESGLKALNLSMDDTGLPSHFLMLKHFFENGYQADFCILNLDEAHYQQSRLELGDNDYRFAPFAHKDYVHDYYQQYEKGLVKPLAHSTAFPFLSLAYYNIELFYPGLLTTVRPEQRYRFDNSGNYSYPDNLKYRSDPGEELIEREVILKNPLLTEISNYLAKHQCELVLYIAPYRHRRPAFQFEIDPLPLINHSGIFDSDSLFYNHQHVNRKGRKLATDRFQESFKDIMSQKSK